MTDDQIEKTVKDCIKKLYKNDGDIIANDINERTITHKLAEYLCPYFRHYSVDVDYNRNIDKSKEYNNGKKGLPDIVVHKRKLKEKNLLIIEVKKVGQNQGRDTDQKKLEAFTNKEGDYGYQLGLFLDIAKNWQDTELTWYKGGILKKIVKL